MRLSSRSCHRSPDEIVQAAGSMSRIPGYRLEAVHSFRIRLAFPLPYKTSNLRTKQLGTALIHVALPSYRHIGVRIMKSTYLWYTCNHNNVHVTSAAVACDLQVTCPGEATERQVGSLCGYSLVSFANTVANSPPSIFFFQVHQYFVETAHGMQAIEVFCYTDEGLKLRIVNTWHLKAW